LLEHVVADRNLSVNTQKSYRDAILRLLRFVNERHGIDPSRLAVEQVDAHMVRGFLAHLEEDRHNSAATRNLRLTAIQSLFRFIGREAPEFVTLATQMQEIPARKTPTPLMPYLEKAEMDALLAAPDRQSCQGGRDYALLLFLYNYNTGARATEAASTTVGSLQLADPPSVQLFGKGSKARLCPLWPHTRDTLVALRGPHTSSPTQPLFLNVRGQAITRFGIHTMVERNAAKAAEETPSLRDKRVSPHTIRHTTAVFLLRAGVDINTIRAWLGHVSLQTTNRYAEVDLEMKAKALASCADGTSTAGADTQPSSPAWRMDAELMAFLTSL